MLEQYKYHTITEDIKSLIQYVQHYAIKHPVIEAANRLNKAIKKNVDVGLIPIKVYGGKQPMKKANITLSCSFWVDCPECGALLDLADSEYNYKYKTKAAIFTGQWEDLEGRTITCVCCNSDFEIGEICE